MLETNIDFDENIYFNHYCSVFGKFDFESPVNERQIPCLMSREFLYSYFEVRQNITIASKETIPQIIGRIKQFSNSLDSKFNMTFFDNMKYYSEILGLEETKNQLIPVLVKIVLDKIDVKIHFLKVLHQNFIDYLSSMGDEGINILRQNIIQIIQELYRDKNIKNEALNILLFKVFIKIAKSIIHKEKDKNDNYMLDLVMSFGYESNVSKDFYLEHKKICIRFISTLAEDFGQDWAENYLLPQMWFFACDEETEIKQEVLIALPNLCQELRYEIIGTKVFKLIKKLTSDKLPIIRQGIVAALAKIIKIYKEKSTIEQQKNEKNTNAIKLDPGSIINFLGLIEKLILDKEKCVRDSIIEYIGEIINPLEKKELSQKIFDFYKNAVNEFYYNKEMISSTSPSSSNSIKNKYDKKEEKEKKENVNYYFAYNFPAILYCYGKEVWPKLSPLFTNLCREKDIKVRRSIIASFHEVSKIVGEKITEEELLPLYDNFLNSKNALEKNFAIKNLPKILSNVNKEIKEKYFKYFDAVSIFQQNMGSKVRNFFFINWRNKIDVIEGILCYYHLYDKDIIYKSILPQCINFCFDDVYKVRSVSCKILATLILYLYKENYKKTELFELLELFALNKKYYQRICFSKMCKVLLENIDLYNEKIKSLLYILVNNDKSKNVRVALSKALAKIFKQNKFKALNEISLHKICKILNNGKNISISNIFNSIDIDMKNFENINDEEIFDLDNINSIIGNKPKIFDKENSFIKKEFDFDINECQHKFPKRQTNYNAQKNIIAEQNKEEKNQNKNIDIKEKNEHEKKENENVIKNKEEKLLNENDEEEIEEKNEKRVDEQNEKNIKVGINKDLLEGKKYDEIIEKEEEENIQKEIKDEIKNENLKEEEIKINKEEEKNSNLKKKEIEGNKNEINTENKEKNADIEENSIDNEKVENAKKEEIEKIKKNNLNEKEDKNSEIEDEKNSKNENNKIKGKERMNEQNKNENNENKEEKKKDNNLSKDENRIDDDSNGINKDKNYKEENESIINSLEEKGDKEEKEEKEGIEEKLNGNNSQSKEGHQKNKK